MFEPLAPRLMMMSSALRDRGMHHWAQPSPNCHKQLFVFPSFILLHKSEGAFVLHHLFIGKLSSGGTFQSGIKTNFSRRNAVFLFLKTR